MRDVTLVVHLRPKVGVNCRRLDDHSLRFAGAGGIHYRTDREVVARLAELLIVSSACDDTEPWEVVEVTSL